MAECCGILAEFTPQQVFLLQMNRTDNRSANGVITLSRQEIALIIITMVWGSTFLTVHFAVEYSPPFFFVGFRFLTAGLFSALMFRRHLKGMTLREVLAGTAIGAAICLGYGLQTWGLQTISGSLSGFITALYVPMVPILQWLVLKRAPHMMSWLGILLAFSGLVLLSGAGSGNTSLSAGEIATLFSALAIACEIILISKFAGRVDIRRVTVVQLFAAGIFSLAVMPLSGERLPAFSGYWLICGVSLAAASAIIQFTMNWAQKSVSPTKATIIYAGEPVWAGVFGRIAGDTLPAMAIVGAVLIVGGVIISEIRPRFRRPGRPARNDR